MPAGAPSSTAAPAPAPASAVIAFHDIPTSAHDALIAALNVEQHQLATRSGSSSIATTSLQAAKATFDAALELEQLAWPRVRALVEQLSPSSASGASPTTRSGAAKQKKQKKGSKKGNTTDDKDEESNSSLAAAAAALIPFTSLSELFVAEGLAHEQIWQQLEMRAKTSVALLEAVGVANGGEGEDEANEEELDRRARMLAGGRDDEDEEDEDDEDMDDSEEDDSDDDDDDSAADEEEERILSIIQERRPDLYAKFARGEELDEKDWESLGDLGEGFDDLSGEEDDDEEEEEVDEDVDMEDLEEEEDEMESDLEGDSEQDEEGEEADDDDEAPVRKTFHPELDDRFFSIDDFNRQTEEAEAAFATRGKLGDDDEDSEDDEEEDSGDLAGLLGRDVEADEAMEENAGDIMYADFFAPPPKMPSKDKSQKGKGKGKGKAKARDSVRFAEQEDEAMDGPEDDEDEDDAAPTDGRTTFDRVKSDLFADDDEAQAQAAVQNLSSFERRQLELKKQIESLEQENVGPKDWTLLGEATAKARPENSLLEESLDFEQAAKVVPIITEERVTSLEDLIKRRILDGAFDDIVRRRELDDKAFLPSRYFELQDSASARSLAQIYEDDFSAAASGGKAVDARDAKLSKDHEEIERLWEEISYKLDALSNLHFTPKQPKATITTISNVASAAMESALPTAQSTSTMLAPEEMSAPAGRKDLVARSELTPEEKRREHQRARKEKMHNRKALDSAVDKYAGKGGGGGKARGGVRAEKDRALQELVKTGKGVTVVGKESVKKRSGRPESTTSSQAAGLKL